MNKLLLFIMICMSQLLADLIHPQDESELNYIHILFHWGAENNISSYEFELSNTEDFSNIINSNTVTDTTYFVKYLSWETNYYWRVKTGDQWINTNNYSIGPTLSDVSVIWHDEKNKYSDGYTIFGTVDGYYSAIIDSAGNEIWNSGNDSIIYYNFLDNGKFFGAIYSPNNTYQYPGTEFSLSGGIKWREPNEEFVHHEFMQLPWGDYMGIAHETRLGPIHATGTYQTLYQAQFFVIADGVTNEWDWWGDHLVIWDKDSKDIKWSWSSFDHFNMSDYEDGLWNTPPQPAPDDYFDWTHINAFYFDIDSSIYISTRNLSRITKLKYPSGEIIWNMGHDMASGDVTFGHDLGFSHQHSINVLDNGNILIFDNGKYSNEYWDWGADSLKSRALEIKITGNNGQYSAEIVWEYILPPDLFGPDAGNVQKLSNDNYLITTSAPPGTSLEVTPDSIIVWEANYSTYAMWRASRIPKSIIEDTQMENTLSLYNSIIPNEWNIEKIYPNPFNPIINIEYEISKLGFISVKILKFERTA